MVLNLLKKAVIIIILLNFSQFLYADENENYVIQKSWGRGRHYSTANEFLSFPEFCKARYYPQKSSMYKKWLKRIGPDFIHLHHG